MYIYKYIYIIQRDSEQLIVPEKMYQRPWKDWLNSKKIFPLQKFYPKLSFQIIRRNR